MNHMQSSQPKKMEIEFGGRMWRVSARFSDGNENNNVTVEQTRLGWVQNQYRNEKKIQILSANLFF